jgi:C4-dicarboxylate transporter DctM subunit
LSEPLEVRLRALGSALPVPVLSALVVGGMLSGVFTATEAGAFGCMGAILLAVVLMRRPKDIWTSLWSAMSSTVSSVGQIMFLIIGAALLTRGVALSGLPVMLVEKVNQIGLGRVGFLLVLVGLYLVLGTFLEPIPMMLMTIPFLLPVLETLEIDLIWFGIFVVLLGELGMVTPPVGILVFIVHKLAQHPAVRGATEIRLSDVYAAATWLLLVPMLLVLALIAFPGMVSILSAG